MCNLGARIGCYIFFAENSLERHHYFFVCQDFLSFVHKPPYRSVLFGHVHFIFLRSILVSQEIEKARKSGCAHLEHLPKVKITVNAIFPFIADLCKCVDCGLKLS